MAQEACGGCIGPRGGWKDRIKQGRPRGGGWWFPDAYEQLSRRHEVFWARSHIRRALSRHQLRCDMFVDGDSWFVECLDLLEAMGYNRTTAFEECARIWEEHLELVAGDMQLVADHPRDEMRVVEDVNPWPSGRDDPSPGVAGPADSPEIEVFGTAGHGVEETACYSGACEEHPAGAGAARRSPATGDPDQTGCSGVPVPQGYSGEERRFGVSDSEGQSDLGRLAAIWGHSGVSAGWPAHVLMAMANDGALAGRRSWAQGRPREAAIKLSVPRDSIGPGNVMREEKGSNRAVARFKANLKRIRARLALVGAASPGSRPRPPARSQRQQPQGREGAAARLPGPSRVAGPREGGDHHGNPAQRQADREPPGSQALEPGSVGRLVRAAAKASSPEGAPTVPTVLIGPLWPRLRSKAHLRQRQRQAAPIARQQAGSE